MLLEVPEGGVSGGDADVVAGVLGVDRRDDEVSARAGTDGDGGAADLLDLVPEHPQQRQQASLLRAKLLLRPASKAGNQAGNHPARQAHIDHRDERAGFLEDDGGLARVVGCGHGALLFEGKNATIRQRLRRLPHSIYLRKIQQTCASRSSVRESVARHRTGGISQGRCPRPASGGNLPRAIYEEVLT